MYPTCVVHMCVIVCSGTQWPAHVTIAAADGEEYPRVRRVSRREEGTDRVEPRERAGGKS